MHSDAVAHRPTSSPCAPSRSRRRLASTRRATEASANSAGSARTPCGGRSWDSRSCARSPRGS
eukprot:7389659-Prymnesium_polylepis.1